MGLNSLIHWYFATESHLFSIAVLRKTHLQCSPHLFGSSSEPVPWCLLKTCTALIFETSISKVFIVFWSWKEMQEESKPASMLIRGGIQAPITIISQLFSWRPAFLTEEFTCSFSRANHCLSRHLYGLGCPCCSFPDHCSLYLNLLRWNDNSLWKTPDSLCTN